VPLFPERRLGSGLLMPRRWSAGCGPDSLYLALSLIGVDCGYIDLTKRIGICRKKQRVSMNDLWQAAQEVGAHGVGVETNEEKLTEILEMKPRVIAILHLEAQGEKERHFVCAYLSRARKIALAERGPLRDELAKTWRKRWSGKALLLCREPLVRSRGSSGRGPHPRIHLDQVTFDAGKQAYGGECVFSLVIRNTGQAPLHLKGVIPNCTCTDVQLTKERIDVGQSGALQGTIHVGRRSGPRSARIGIISDDPERPRIDVAVIWEVRPPGGRCYPKVMVFDKAVQDEEMEASVQVRPTGDRPMAISSITCDEKWIGYKHEAGSNAFVVRVTPDWCAGAREGMVFVRLVPSGCVLALPVRAHVIPRVAIDPSELFAASVNGEAVVTQVEVWSAGGKKELKVINATLKGLPGGVESVTPSSDHKNGWVLRLKCGPFGEKKSLFAVGSLVIQTTESDDLTVPIYVRR